MARPESFLTAESSKGSFRSPYGCSCFYRAIFVLLGWVTMPPRQTHPGLLKASGLLWMRRKPFPILQKNQFAALAPFVVVMCGAEYCFCYVSFALRVFILVVLNNKADRVPGFIFPLKSSRYENRDEFRVTPPDEVLPFIPFSVTAN